MGEVWQARDTTLDRDVALKVPRFQEQPIRSERSGSLRCPRRPVATDERPGTRLLVVVAAIRALQLGGKLPLNFALLAATQDRPVLGCAQDEVVCARVHVASPSAPTGQPRRAIGSWRTAQWRLGGYLAPRPRAEDIRVSPTPVRKSPQRSNPIDVPIETARHEKAPPMGALTRMEGAAANPTTVRRRPRRASWGYAWSGAMRRPRSKVAACRATAAADAADPLPPSAPPPAPLGRS